LKDLDARQSKSTLRYMSKILQWLIAGAAKFKSTSDLILSILLLLRYIENPELHYLKSLNNQLQNAPDMCDKF